MFTTTTTKSFAGLKLIPFKSNIKFHLLFADLIGITAFWFIASSVYGQPFKQGTILIFAIYASLFESGLYLADAYQPDTQVSGLRAPVRIVICGLLLAGVFACLLYLSDGLFVLPPVGRKFWLTALASSMAWSSALRVYASQRLKSDGRRGKWLVLGTNERVVEFAQQVRKETPFASFVVLTEDSSATAILNSCGISCIRDASELSRFSEHRWTGIITSDSGGEEGSLSEYASILMRMRLEGMPVYRLPDFYEKVWFKLPTSWLHDDWFSFSSGFHLLPGSLSMRRKRFFDIFFSALALLLLTPLFLLIATSIKLDTPGPVFYSQVRSGLGNKPFKVYKFRSMRRDAEKMGAQWAMERDPRITRVGYFLRLSRLDELPQLWNVLKGEMSLIGPRPERPEFDLQLSKNIPYYQIRYMVPPGITGWAQVMYPYGASAEDAYAKLSYDLFYIKNYSIWLDIAICFKTVRVMLLGKGR